MKVLKKGLGPGIEVIGKAAAVLMLSAVSSVAVAQFAGSVTVTSDYDYRGYSQTSGDMALQGGLDYSHDSGFYVSLWGSSLDWGPGADANIELNYVVGFTNDIGDTGVSYDVGLLYYDYPGAGESDFLEIYGGLSWNILTIKVSYSDDFAGLGASGWYVDGGVTYGFENGISIFAYAGYSFGDAFDASEGQPFGAPDYYNYGIGASYTIAERITLDVRGVGTNQDGIHKIEEGVFENDFRGLASISISFP